MNSLQLFHFLITYNDEYGGLQRSSVLFIGHFLQQITAQASLIETLCDVIGCYKYDTAHAPLICYLIRVAMRPCSPCHPITGLRGTQHLGNTPFSDTDTSYNATCLVAGRRVPIGIFSLERASSGSYPIRKCLTGIIQRRLFLVTPERNLQ